MATGGEIVFNGFVVEACSAAVDMGVCGVGVWCTSNGRRQGLRNNIRGVIEKVILGGGGWVDSAIGENGLIKNDMTGDNNVIGG
ncbi:hypothetical protein Tco_1497080 [Tanacetum coccineum]